MRLILAVAVIAVSGCQRYQSAPVDLTEYAQTWRQRNASSADVATYAATLARASVNHATSRFDPSDGVSLEEAEVLALYFNPEVRVARLRAKVATAGATEAGRWQDPVLRVDVERILEGVKEPWVIGGLVDLTLPLSGTPALERALATAEADVALLQAVREEQRILRELDAAWLELQDTRQRRSLSDTFLTDLDRAVTQTDRLQAAGEIGPLEAGLLRIQRARQQSAQRRLAAKQRDQEAVILALLGLHPDAAISFSDEFPAPSPAWASSAESGRQIVAERHIDLRHATHEHAVAERKLELAIRRQYPDLTLGGGYGHDEDTTRILGGLSLPIPIFNGNRREIAESFAAREAARAVVEHTFQALVSRLSRAESLLGYTREEVGRLRTEVVPLVDAQLKSAQDLRRIGTADLLTLFETLELAHETRLQLLEATVAEAAAVNQMRTLLRPILPAPAEGTP